jgi:hypothetical protein
VLTVMRWVELAGAESRRAGLQYPDRQDHAAGQQQASATGENQPGEQQCSGPQRGADKRFHRLGDR